MDVPVEILIVDDDGQILILVAKFLRGNGFRVHTARNGVEMFEVLKRASVDLIVLDLMLPGRNGLELCRELRRSSSVPIIMLTAKGDETDRIIGLEVGADDYLPKPFNPRELLARLRAVIRRSVVAAEQSRRAPQPPITVGDLTVDPGARSATLDGLALALTPTEFDLLLALARDSGKVMTREQLLLEVADRDFEAFDRSIDVHISSLRRKLGDDPRNARRIVTVRSAGYLLQKPDGGADS